MNIIQKFHRWKEMRRFKHARNKADYMNQLSGKKHLVMKLSGEYFVINRDNLKGLRKTKKFRNLTFFEFEQRALYIANNRTSNINQ